MNKLRTLLRLSRSAAEHFSALLLGSMFAVFILQIVFRYFLNLPVGWTVEWVTIAWLWGILFSFAFVVRAEDMIRLDIVYSSVSEPVRRVLDVFSGLCCAGIFLWTLPMAWDYVDFMQIERTAYMRLPFNWVFAIYIPFHIAVIIRMLVVAWSGLSGHNRHVNATDAQELHSDA